MSKRTELIEVARRLGLEFKGNAKTTTIQALVDAKLEGMNKVILKEEERGVEIPADLKELVVNRGVHPITGKAVK